jgi:plastocyanin
MGKSSRRNFLKAGVALGATPLIAGSRAPEGEVIPVTVTNRVSVVKGEIVYEKPRVRVRPGDTIHWMYPDGQMSIHFPGIVPVDRSSYQANSQGVISLTIPATSTLFGNFKYFVAVTAQGIILTDDPDIIIDPKGGRG